MRLPTARRRSTTQLFHVSAGLPEQAVVFFENKIPVALPSEWTAAADCSSVPKVVDETVRQNPLSLLPASQKVPVAIKSCSFFFRTWRMPQGQLSSATPSRKRWRWDGDAACYNSHAISSRKSFLRRAAFKVNPSHLCWATVLVLTNDLGLLALLMRRATTLATIAC